MVKVIVALSGGVDSTYAAYLLMKQGYEVEGLSLDLFPGSKAPGDALAAAGFLGIKIQVKDRHEIFRREVIDYFCKTYQAGETPNPCVACNRMLKFANLLAHAEEAGAEKIATGHYVRNEYCSATGEFQLLRGANSKKDQSYFLYRLGQDVFSRALFPLGNMTKDEVRAGAKAAGLPVHDKKASQEACFLKDVDYQDLLRFKAAEDATAAGFLEDENGSEKVRYSSVCGLEEGYFVDLSGKPLGIHKGYACYTIGQRKNLGVSFGEPKYVIAINPKANQVVLGREEELYKNTIFTAANTFISGKHPTEPLDVFVKLRSMAQPAAATYIPLPGTDGRLNFAEQQKAPAPGQSAVYYRGDQVLGGGIIKRP